MSLLASTMQYISSRPRPPKALVSTHFSEIFDLEVDTLTRAHAQSGGRWLLASPLVAGCLAH